MPEEKAWVSIDRSRCDHYSMIIWQRTRTSRIGLVASLLQRRTYSTSTTERGIRYLLFIHFKGIADKHKRVFKLSEIDQKSADLAADQRDLDQILQVSVPGLVSKSQRRSGVSQSNTNVTTDGPVASHKLLVNPNVFNISSLLPPSLSFLQRLRDIVPHDSDIAMSTLTSFLDDFLVNVFQPQLEETVTESCTQSLAEVDAFQIDSQWSQHAMRPIFKASPPVIFFFDCFTDLHRAHSISSR